ncbi:isocitrate lyase/phosphoenolpyruvate mutase family protein [Piscinibacter sp. HJYY11]|uniref:isocitrate lyase/PEP mutase family protein n=1 Tax=Piscinibacter sp. HJYY11 TaxID=2801333 RepID=UPI00191E8A59|nr:isocitrate lyase/phosphoenolpyruvate mutase family protein [Piscinibacter sp. HJYY11]MBL0727863.1 isocitrate lyase/phosphoenolpyruvate mutase family protein [Piscinibacter sp. HJYY11]
MTFLDLHRAERGFVMPNAWDAGTAVLLAEAGFAAIGTTSAGIAFSLGKPDFHVRHAHLAVTRDETLDAVKRIASAVPLPVNADLEAGYGDTPEQVAESVRLAIAAGAAGCNIEDTHRATGRLFDEAEAVERIAAASEAVRASGRAFVLNARTDVFQHGGDQGLARAIERGNRFIAAGADCVFTPGVADAERARTLVREIGGPLNLVVGLNEAASSATALLDVGVKRISVGGSIARAALGLVRQAALELRERGTVAYASGQIPQGELNALFERAWARRP